MAIAKGLALVLALVFFSCVITVSVAELWCVANPKMPVEIIQAQVDKLCADGGASYRLEDYCTKIKPGGSCFEPNTAMFHGSVLFNALYVSNREPKYCLDGRGEETGDNPSTKTCKFEAGGVPLFISKTN